MGRRKPQSNREQTTQGGAAHLRGEKTAHLRGQRTAPRRGEKTAHLRGQRAAPGGGGSTSRPGGEKLAPRPILAVNWVKTWAFLLLWAGVGRGTALAQDAAPPDAIQPGFAVQRTLYGESPTPEEQTLPTGANALPITVRGEIWRVTGARRLRVESPAPEPRAVLRFAPAPETPGAVVLSVIVVGQPGRKDDALLEDSWILVDGTLAEAPRFLLEQGIETDLAGIEGRVTQIRVQDDGSAEIRLAQRDDTLILQVVPAAQGGAPEGASAPAYFGQHLRFMEYDLLVGGYTDNGYVEAVIWRDFVLKINAQIGTPSATAARLVLRQEVARGNRLSLWLEGGGGYYTIDPEPASNRDHKTPVWAFGATGHYRYGDWGAALHLALLKGESLYMLLGSWQVADWLGLMLEYQGFAGGAGYGIGAGFDF